MKSENISETLHFNGPHFYVHVPFCRRRCDYCDFFTRTSVPDYRQNEIIQRIVQQAKWFNLGSRALRTIYVGGGTPSSLVEPARLGLLRFLNQLLPTGSEIEYTVEVNPEDVTPDYLRLLEQYGVNRLSVGIQSLSAAALTAMGRHTSFGETLRGLDTIATHWEHRWSADIIVAVPGMTVSDVEQDIRHLMERRPRHVSLYELGIEYHTPLGLRSRRGRLTAPDEDEILAQLHTGAALLRDSGLCRYEISSFAVAGDESRHNLAYWKMEPHLGLGPGAVGTFPVSPGGTVLRVTNSRSFPAFMTQKDFGIRLDEIPFTDQAKELVMMGLRTVFGVDAAAFERILGEPFQSVCSDAMAAWPDAFDMSRKGTIRLHRTWWDRLDAVLVSLFEDIDTFCLK
jgi:oxygen-independent coproporphyrinogen III oxidase